MKHDLTSAIAALPPGRPLIVSDADGVLLQFTGGFETWLDQRGLYLDLSHYRLEGAIHRKDDNAPVLLVETMALIDEFRSDLDWLEAVDGACEALALLQRHASIVVLSNVNLEQAPARRRNLDSLGIAHPLIANDSGAGYLADKGAAVKALAAHARAPTFFIDDVPSNLSDVAKAAPDVTLVHVVESEKLRALLPGDIPAHCRAADWNEVTAFILNKLG